VSNSRQHGRSPRHPTVRPVPEPSLAERARTLMHIAPHGRPFPRYPEKHPGLAFRIAHALCARSGRDVPSSLVSSMAMHTQKPQYRPSCQPVSVTQPNVSGDPLGAARRHFDGANWSPPAPMRGERFISKCTRNAQLLGLISTTFL